MFRDGAALDVEDLLFHATGLKRLATRLAKDDAAADDLVQETFLVAVKNPPREGKALQAWLGRVLRNLALSFRRREGSRPSREQAASMARTAPSPEAVLASFELQRDLARAVHELPEPYRTAILLRFYADLEPDDSAKAAGTPAATMRSRVRRGLAMLRERLGSEDGADRRAVVGTIAPFAAAKGGKSAALAATAAATQSGEGAAVSTAVAAGVVLMKMKLVLFAASAIVLAGIAYWALGPVESPADLGSRALAPDLGGNDGRASGLASAADSRAVAPVAATPFASEDDASASRAKGASPLGESELHGRVLDPSGSPVREARVVVERHPSRDASGLDLKEIDAKFLIASGSTDDQGEFRFRLPRGRLFDVAIETGGYPRTVVRDRYAGDFVPVQLAHGAVVTGRVTRKSDGGPISGAGFRIMRRIDAALLGEGSTDNDGYLHAAGIEPCAAWVQLAPAVEGAFRWLEIDVKPGVVTRADIEVDSGTTIEGRVTDAETGRPIVDAEIGPGWMFRRTVRSGPDGRYELRGFGGGHEDVHVRAAGYGRTERRIGKTSAEKLTVDFALSVGRELRGRVVGADGAPIEGAYVAAPASKHNRGVQSTDWPSTRTGADGTFVVKDLRRDLRVVSRTWWKK
jgi:RNA polymerase sigma factor (sigma-70 family)